MANDGYIRLWDVALRKDVDRFTTKGRWCGLAFTPDDRFLVAYDEEQKRMTMWTVATGVERCSWTVHNVPKVVTFDPRGQILATGHDDGSIALWNAATGQKKQTLGGHLGSVRSLKYTPDGKTLVSSGSDGTIRLWNPEQPRAWEIIHLGPAKGPLNVDIDPSGQYYPGKKEAHRSGLGLVVPPSGGVRLPPPEGGTTYPGR